MKIIALAENTSKRPEIGCEHGLSLYIEAAGQKILFDMGQSALFAENAAVLGADLAAVSLCVLSHGHYDHGGGLAHFLQINEKAPIYMHKDAFLPHYNGTERYIGLDTSLGAHGRIVFTEGRVPLGEGLTLVSASEIPRRHPKIAHGLTERVKDGFIEDDFRHEQYLLIEDAGKRVLISGCSHVGILDIASHFKPDVLIGGFHFSKMTIGELLLEAANILNRQNTDFYTCQCTGTAQFDFMKKYMRRLRYISCGNTIEI